MRREGRRGETNERVEDNNVEEDCSSEKECRRLVKGVIVVDFSPYQVITRRLPKVMMLGLLHAAGRCISNGQRRSTRILTRVLGRVPVRGTDTGAEENRLVPGGRLADCQQWPMDGSEGQRSIPGRNLTVVAGISTQYRVNTE
jgi:hypothetical protein